MPPATANIGSPRGCASNSARRALWLPKKEWTATSDSPRRTSIRASFGFILLRKLSQGLFGFLDIVERQLTGFHQASHYRPAAEETQQFVDQPVLRRVTRNLRFENVRVADSLHIADGLLAFHSI